MEQTLTTPLTRASGGIGADEFDLLWRAHHARIYRVLWCELRDADAAVELTQECFLRAYRSRDRFRNEASVTTWLVRIAVNLARDHQRSRRYAFWRKLFGPARAELQDWSGSMADGNASPEQTAIARQEVAQVLRVAESLPEQQRTAFILRFVEELGLADISNIMGVEVGTVKSHLARAVGALRRWQELQTK